MSSRVLSGDMGRLKVAPYGDNAIRIEFHNRDGELVFALWDITVCTAIQMIEEIEASVKTIAEENGYKLEAAA